jgi:hypothetical protein
MTVRRGGCFLCVTRLQPDRQTILVHIDARDLFQEQFAIFNARVAKGRLVVSSDQVLGERCNDDVLDVCGRNAGDRSNRCRLSGDYGRRLGSIATARRQ